ncbi:MAG: TldD/PmbA family protein [Proteobacteria bacterium]|nr:TldD/PmbA family protein [Pseudomonadota bacterium]
MMRSDEDLAQALLAAARRAGAAAADVLVVSATSTNVGVSGGKLEEAERAERRDLGLRVLIGQRQACVSSSDARAEALAEMAERAVAMAREAPDDPWCGLAEAGELAAIPDIAGLEMADPAEPPEPAALEQAALAAEAAALGIGGVSQVEQASASWGRDRITLAATNGFAGSYQRTSAGIRVSAIAGEGLGREGDYAGESRRFLADLPAPAGIGERAGRRAVERLGPRKPPAGRFPVLFDERVAASLIGHLLAAINGQAVARGASWLRQAMETRILPAGFDLIEDPLIRRGPASRPFDGEGFAGRRRLLVADGVLRSWVLDLATARQLGLQSTGNARRGVAAPPSPGTGNIRVTEGAASRDDLIAAMGTGLLVTSMIGASVNATTGAYSRGATGFWVEGGAIAYPVNEVTVAGSLPEMLRSLAPANDADPHKVRAVPSLLVEGLTVGA